ncbi:MAG: peptidylprolyl isomerase [Desulfobacteraceae bacterium]|jgi:peptidyl-prolyl cis-trans isomerase B (cyclophilin B)|nr:peptidylprolyl isomerase [Desulfobacteraceae bacterium]
MKIKLFVVIGVLVTFVTAGVDMAIAGNPKVEMETSKGKFVIELFPEKAPDTVKNFLNYVDAKFYDGTIFHRVIPKFMIQGGGFTADMKRKPAGAPIKNEADNGLKNDRGTIAMARTNDPHSATAQFFINTVNNDFLNHKSKTQQGWGYVVFGKVVAGMDVVDAISSAKTVMRGMYRDVPAENIEIRSTVVLK